MATYREAAAAALRAGGPLNYREIVKIAVDCGLLERDDAHTRSVMLGSLGMDIRKKGRYAPFVKTGPGMFDLHPDLKAEFGGRDFGGRPAYGPSPRKAAPKKPRPKKAAVPRPRRAAKKAAGGGHTAKRGAGQEPGDGRAAKKAAGSGGRRAAKKAAGGGRAAGRGAGKRPVREEAVPADPAPAGTAGKKAPRRTRRITPVGGRVRKAARTDARIAGRAGGHAVVSELLFRGFEAGLAEPGGDTDIAARRGGAPRTWCGSARLTAGGSGSGYPAPAGRPGRQGRSV